MKGWRSEEKEEEKEEEDGGERIVMETEVFYLYHVMLSRS